VQAPPVTVIDNGWHHQQQQQGADDDPGITPMPNRRMPIVQPIKLSRTMYSAASTPGVHTELLPGVNGRCPVVGLMISSAMIQSTNKAPSRRPNPATERGPSAGRPSRSPA
jgi:hypothetical protein